MSVMVRTIEQLEFALQWKSQEGSILLEMVYCDFEDLRRYADAVKRGREAGVKIGLATLRIAKPREEGLHNLILKAAPDAVLCRNLASVLYFRDTAPSLPLLGDYSLNVANELTADLMLDLGLRRIVPSYDLNMRQFAAMAGRIAPRIFEVVVHQHMPMFHMEHCIFAHTLSKGKDFRDCGRPCDRHRVDLKDRAGILHPLLPDTGCRNTLYNGTAQSAAPYISDMRKLGVGHFRVEILRETAGEMGGLMDRYAALIAGRQEASSTRRQLAALTQFGVSAGTFDHE